VADLQDALTLLLERRLLLAEDEGARRELLQALQRQRAEQIYGSATAKLVARFQEEHRLQPTGEVAEPTANALNALLKELGVLGSGEATFVDARYTVLCRAVDARAKPIAGLRIELFHQDPQSPPAPLGEPATTDADGLATFRFKRSDFTDQAGERGPNLFFTVSRDEVPLDYTLPGLPFGGNVIRNFQPQREPIVLRIERHETIRGIVVTEHGVPAANLRLRLYRRDFGGRTTQLAETTTQAGGRYAFVVDSVFNSSPTHVQETCEAILRRRLRLRWGCFLRPQGLNRDLMRLMARAGLSHIEFGTDSFCDSVLAAYGKHFTFADILDAAELARAEYNLRVTQARVERKWIKKAGGEKALAPTAEDRARILLVALDADEELPGPFLIQGDHAGGVRFRNITVRVPRQ
jgi:hypothetical protein